MITIILSLLSICNPGFGAPVQPSSTSSFDTSDTSGEIRFVTNYRSTPEIIWTCLITTLLCTWVSMHPDIVGYNSTRWQRIKARMLWFLVAFIAPELALIYALYQWRVADYVAYKIGGRKTFRTRTAIRIKNLTVALVGERLSAWLKIKREDDDDNPWKRFHGHFLLMGGVIFDIDGRYEYISLWKLSENPNDGESNDGDSNLNGGDKRLFDARNTLKSLPSKNIEILDRSKGDALTKGLTFVQTFWFIVQFAARGVQNLNVTALEVITLVYAVTALLAYIFWWDKPLHVQNPIVIPLPPVDYMTTGLSLNQPRDQLQAQPAELEEPEQYVNVSPSQTALAENPADHEFVEYRYWPVWWSRTTLAEDRAADLNVNHRIPFFSRLTILVRQMEKVNPASGVLYLAMALLGVPGSFYYIAWNFTFPKLPIGRILWRVSCLVSTSIQIYFAAPAVGGFALGLALIPVVLGVLAVKFLLRACWRVLSRESEPKDQPEESEAQLEESKDQLEESKDQLEESKDQLPPESKNQLEELKDQLEESKDQLEESKDRLEESKDQLEESREEPHILLRLIRPLEKMSDKEKRIVIGFYSGLIIIYLACYIASRLILDMTSLPLEY
ncbi:hypothetical protein EST38_g5430 [Candolleomyces aberdarensis]|uniref:Uncharacterized protein n=1 Tax=Candolleomyces aberdarensis TaxID=2316362 RepID=A0A4Q2DKF9_9AGAR|nr:hypothetical protein EST38_g5430 [Candolleomyces aberdarensis]